MVSRLDRGVGRILSLLARLGLDEDTIVFFASDNGPTFNGGTDSRFFESAGPFRGLKASLYEGGMRVPLVARWPGSVPGKRVSAHASAFWDLLPTFMELAGAPRPSGIDGVSMVPELLGQAAAQKPHEYLYWEFQQRQAVRLGRWKAIRAAATDAVELYDLEGDVAESRNVAGDHLDLVRRAREIMQAARTESDLFPLVGKRKSGVVR
jgi:arylsulfatase